MAEKVLMLALSPTMESGTIVSWTKHEGDEIKSGDVLCEVETDKATMEYESIQEGMLLKILVDEGGHAKVEDPIAIVGKKGENIDSIVKEIEEEQAKSGNGAGPKSPVASPTQSAETAVNAPQGRDDAGGRDRAGEPANGSRLKASPLARRLAEQEGIELSSLRGSGPEGRIVKRDIDRAAQGRPAPRPAAAGAGRPQAAPVAAALTDETIPISNRRKVIAQRLSESKFTSPHYYLRMTAFTETMMQARSKLNATMDHKVSVNAFLLKFAAEAIKRNPVINSSWEGDSIRRFGSIDIGLAVAMKDGLLTPIVRNCGGKGIIAIDDELSDLIDRARVGKLAPEEFTGATFTISSLGTFGVEEFTAIINPPGSAILAVGQMQKAAVVDEHDQIGVRMQMKMTLSCDHRVIDGAQGAFFLNDLKEMIENPVRALF